MKRGGFGPLFYLIKPRQFNKKSLVMMRSFIKFADRLSISMGKAFSWCIVILMGGTCYEVFMAYALNAPTLWNFDFSLQMYGAIFIWPERTHFQQKHTFEEM